MTSDCVRRVSPELVSGPQASATLRTCAHIGYVRAFGGVSTQGSFCGTPHNGVARSLAGPGLAWHDHGMTRTRLSTTVDADLLEGARRVISGVTDAALIEALLVRHRAAELDASYAAYDAHPLDEPDEWGDLASFRQAAAAS